MYKYIRIPGCLVKGNEAPPLPMDQNLASILLLMTSEAVETGSLILPDFTVQKTPTHISLVPYALFDGFEEFVEIRVPCSCYENISGTLANFLVS